ncbi:twitch domain-containing radical SAM protein [Halobacteriovorax sp. HLS]|uniref:twitch domain-containing radical SAM protein n=1 Tax=Halobacteriovorax sp. HLS TaxID=2234000 RepID=UPI0013E3043B|nr:twitch domain-containing radical SAM protein [Halobacteriovorax sp. HLS]
MNRKTPNNAFCIAAWAHTFISPQSERRLCCASKEEMNFAGQYLGKDSQSTPELTKEYSPISLEQHWNSDFLKSIRLKMLAGEIPKECSACHENVIGSSSYRDYFNEEVFPDLIDIALKNTAEDGSTNLSPVSFDYRFNNKCNFSCRMCGNQLSSKWEKEVIENHLWSRENEPWLIPEIKEKIKNFQLQVVEKEFMTAIDNSLIRELYWAGGEPLLWEIHWQGMQKLIDSGQAKDIIVRYNTNLSLTQFKSQDLFSNFLSHFKKVTIAASIDATGEIGEYIRTGLNWKKWLENLKRAKSFCDNNENTELIIDLTLTLPGLFDLKSLILLSTELRIKILSKLIITYDASVVLSPLALPRKSFNQLINDLIKFNILHLSEYNKELLDSLVELKKCKTYEEQCPITYKKDFYEGRQKQLRTEKIRNDKFTLADIYKSRQDIYDWWTS